MKSIFAFIFVVGFGVLGAQGAAPLPVECTVLSPKGETVAGAEVKFILRPNYNQEAEKDEILATGSTDAAGVFRMTPPDRALEAIKYGTVLASKTGVGIGGVAAAFVRPDGKQMKLSVKLFPAAECRVRLLRPDGSPAAGVKLRVDQCTMPEDSRGYMYTASYLLPNLPEIGWQGITDYEGRCVIPNLPSGAFLYLRHDADDLAQLPGRYMSHFKDAPRALGQESEHRLVAAGSLRGRITLPDGTPVKGGAAYLLEEHPYVTAYGEQLRVDAEGRFEFRQVPPSSYKISFRGPEKDEARWIGDTLPQQLVQAGKTTDVGDLKLSPTAVVTARVLDAETGKEIEEPILFHLKAGTHQLYYRSQRVVPATHLPPGRDDALSVQVAAGEKKSIEFRLKPQKAENMARGIVLDEAGKPAAGAAVQLVGDDEGDFSFPQVCDEAGAFQFVLQKARKGLAVHAWNEKAISEVVELKPGGSVTLSLQSQGLAAIRGVICDEQGKPIKGATFQFMCDGLNSIPSGPLEGFRRVEADGRFSVPVIPRSVKEVTMFAYADGYASASLRDHSLKPGETFEWNPVLKTTGAFVEGTVVDKRGAAVAGAEIRIYGDEQPTNVKPTRTDAQGRFRIDKLASGALRVTAKQKTPDFSRDTWIDAKAPKSDLRLVLPDAEGKVSGVVLDHTGKPVAGAEVRSYSRDRKTVTDKTGHFDLSGLEFGWFSLDLKSRLPDGTRLEKDFRAKTGMMQLKLTLPATADDSRNSSPAPIDLTGKPAPEIHVATWIHTEPLAAKAGGKVRILDFWGMECAPCLAGFPKLQKFWQEHQQDGIELLALGSGFYPEQEVREYLKRHPDLRFPMAIGHTKAKDAEAYQVHGIPTYVVIGKDGRILSSGHDWEKASSIALKAAKP
jgi:hypothetical protein